MSKSKLTTPGKDVVAKKSRISPTEERTERARKKAAESGTMEDSLAAELKNREHGKKPTR
jgi:hypothetical protein